MTEPALDPAAARRDLIGVGALALIALGLLTPWTGIWEPWEADRALVIEHMREAGYWLTVERPQARGGVYVPELAFGWWPVMASTAVLGVNELGLRLPGILLGLLTVLLAFQVMRPLFGRLAAWLGALALLAMPLFVFHSRLLLGAGVGLGVLGLTGLAFLGLATRERPGPLWVWGAWLGLAASGLVEGLPGLAVAGAAALTAALAKRQAGGDWRALVPAPAVGVALGLVAVGWWRSLAHLPEDGDWMALLLWADGLGPVQAAKRPFFNEFAHQLGFGLFPLGAFFPLALADLLWRPQAPGEAPSAAPAAPVLAVLFAAGFLAPALGQPFGQWGYFMAAPAVAVAVGAYFARALREPPQPLLALAAVLMLALLDSNLKHETRALADLLVGTEVDAFPAKLPGWWVSRLLDMGLLGALILFQGGLIRWVRPAVRWLFYPKTPIRLFTLEPSRTWVSLAVGLGGAAAVLARKPDWFERLKLQRFWGRMLPDARVFIVALVLLVAIHLVVWGLWNLRRRRLAGDESGQLDRLTAHAVRLLDARTGRVALVVGLVAAWGGFLNGIAAPMMTRNFSQKGLIQAYEDHAQGDQPLYAYKVAAKQGSFYAKDREVLDRKAFTDKAKGEQRFFAIIPRKKLAQVNGEFRKATDRTVPVLDDRSQRFLLVSNQLGEGEEDRNPIKRALVKALPQGATATNHVFDEKVQLVGWKLDPPQPRPGSPLSINLYWKALKPISGNWKVFVHIDAPGQRIHGDHDPVEGLYGTSDWAPGDIIHDEHRVVVKRTITSNWYTFYLGLYRGNTRMKITTGDKDKENRAKVGKVKVR